MIKSLELQAIESGLPMRLVRIINDPTRNRLNKWVVEKFSLSVKIFRVDRDGDSCNTGQMINGWQ